LPGLKQAVEAMGGESVETFNELSKMDQRKSRVIQPRFIKVAEFPPSTIKAKSR
jgi:hypothetical protein